MPRVLPGLPGVSAAPAAKASGPVAPVPDRVPPATPTVVLGSEPVTTTLPAVATIAPVWLSLPARIRLPVPPLVRAPVPLIGPVSVVVGALNVSVLRPFRVTGPVNVKGLTPPTVAFWAADGVALSRTSGLARVTPTLAWIVPDEEPLPKRVSGPVPSGLLFEVRNRTSDPAPRTVPPE